MWSAQNLGYRSNGLLPNITGQTGEGIRNYTNSESGALYGTNHVNNAPYDGNFSAYDILNFDASRSSSVYQDGVNHVIPACTVIYYMIHY